MSAIETVELRTLPYQPEGTSASRMYSFRGEEGLSLGRLLMGVCLERATMLERMSVGTMNRLARNNSQLEATANAMELLASVDVERAVMVSNLVVTLPEDYPAKGTWGLGQPTIVEFMEVELGIESSSIPGGLMWRYEQRTTAYGLIKAKADALNSVSQETMIDLQTLITERNTAYNLATNGNKILLGGKLNTAGNL